MFALEQILVDVDEHGDANLFLLGDDVTLDELHWIYDQYLEHFGLGKPKPGPDGRFVNGRMLPTFFEVSPDLRTSAERACYRWVLRDELLLERVGYEGHLLWLDGILITLCESRPTNRSYALDLRDGSLSAKLVRQLDRCFQGAARKDDVVYLTASLSMSAATTASCNHSSSSAS